MIIEFWIAIVAFFILVITSGVNLIMNTGNPSPGLNRGCLISMALVLLIATATLSGASKYQNIAQGSDAPRGQSGAEREIQSDS